MGRTPRVTRDAVLEAAREAFATRGYDGTTLADIGRRVGVSAAALMRHEPSKEALFRAAMASGRGEAVSLMELFAKLDPKTPGPSLRRLALRWVPFMEKKIGESFVEWLRSNTGGNPSLRLPFDPRSGESPPRRFLTLLERFLIRAREAGTFHGEDARGTALAFLGALHAHVFLHRVVGVRPAMPLPRYIDTVISIWTRGALAKGRER